MASAASLSEPRVLAHAKRRLFPDDSGPGSYAVADTQFSTAEWLSDRPIPKPVREALAPFNHVRVGSGYPDLVGVGALDADFLAVERFGDRPPLVAVEAKGHTEAGTVDVALAIFDEWRGSRARFCELAPAWGLLTRRVVWRYPATRLLVEEIQTMHDDGIVDPSLVDLLEWLFVHHPAFTVELFVRGTEDARGRVLAPDGELRAEALCDGDVYHSPTVFQLKAMLYHAGILADRRAEPSRLDPRTDSWRLRQPLRASR